MDLKNKLKTASLLKKGIVIYEYDEGHVFLTTLNEKSAKLQVYRDFYPQSLFKDFWTSCGIRRVWSPFSKHLFTLSTVSDFFFPKILSSFRNTIRVYNIETKHFIFFEIDDLLPGAFILADGTPPVGNTHQFLGCFVCFTGNTVLYCKNPSVIAHMEEKTSLSQCRLGELTSSPDFVSWNFFLSNRWRLPISPRSSGLSCC